jgi:hypothetical protein
MGNNEISIIGGESRPYSKIFFSGNNLLKEEWR